MKKRSIALLCAAVMVVGMAIGGTMAWLTAKTSTVKNTFTVGNIDIELKETGATPSGDLLTKDFKMVPGKTLDKDPNVTVKAGSEDRWLFVEVMEGNNLANYINYTVDSANWDEMDEVTGPNGGKVYVYKGSAADGTAIGILTNNKVTVKDSVTKADMDALEQLAANQLPTLTFKAYAIQKAGFETETAAWNQIKTDLGSAS